MIRAVLDTNIISSALFWNGRPRVVFDAALDKQYFALTTEALTAELKIVLAHPKFAHQIANQTLGIEQVVADYLAITVPVLPADIPSDMMRDPKDGAVLACAVEGRANCIVSGDKHLVTLSASENIPILHVEQFLVSLSSE